MNAIAHPTFVTASRLAERAKTFALRAVDAFAEARLRRIQRELELHRSFNAYREGKDIPPLNLQA